MIQYYDYLPLPQKHPGVDSLLFLLILVHFQVSQSLGCDTFLLIVLQYYLVIWPRTETRIKTKKPVLVHSSKH